MSIKEKLRKITGAGNFSDDPKVLETYSRDASFVPPGMPNYVVKVQNSQQVQKVIQLANDNLAPVIPVSSGIHFNGGAIPKQGGIILDMSGMNRILEIDERNRRARLEPGVTWEQIVKELNKKGYGITMPLLPHPRRSVIMDHMEREVIINTVYDYGEPLQGMEVVWPSGEIFRTGSASVNGYPDSPSRGTNPSGPGLDFYRFLQGAQGTMGVVTWANIKLTSQPAMDKIYFSPVTDLDQTIELLYRILRIRIGQECLLLNNVNMASIIAQDFGKDFEKLRAILPPWTLILVLSGIEYRPEDKIKYEENTLNNILKNEFPDIKFSSSLHGINALDKKLLPMLRKPWPGNIPYWKNRYKGACQSLFFITKPEQARMFLNLAYEVAVAYDYPLNDLGGYIQPIEHNRACQVEINLFYDPRNEMEANMTGELYHKMAEILFDEGAIFSRPYGKLAKMVYDKAADYTMTLRRVKKIFDPNNIMNPGNLCF
ncbi:MAG TPA: FAD-binding oxidoreductase [Dehalococcoidia bacterium]|nr:FAD-binding oxidoreductase [Dehalococcoidia bacterium]